MSAVICIENLGKKYAIRHKRGGDGGYRRLSEDLVEMIRRPFCKATPHANGSPNNEEFWALRNVSFQVSQGEVVGIIGRNGAGKSTLLKILSRITEPSEGRLHLKGRVASLLEVGTGFHPELTGRENILLNGAVLGMTRAEIKRKFDEIVDFSGIEKFIDTPVKRYSSGMAVRLGFAVAAHLEPEILVIDEVLAVGDAEFQKKCIGKMKDVAGHGRTVLFVSHNMNSIRQLCTRAVVLSTGATSFDGSVQLAIEKYLGQFEERKIEYDLTALPRQDHLPLTMFMTRLELITDTGSAVIPFGGAIQFRLEVAARSGAPSKFTVGFAIMTQEETPVGVVHSNVPLQTRVGDTRKPVYKNKSNFLGAAAPPTFARKNPKPSQYTSKWPVATCAGVAVWDDEKEQNGGAETRGNSRELGSAHYGECSSPAWCDLPAASELLVVRKWAVANSAARIIAERHVAWAPSRSATVATSGRSIVAGRHVGARPTASDPSLPRHSPPASAPRPPAFSRPPKSVVGPRRSPLPRLDHRRSLRGCVW